MLAFGPSLHEAGYLSRRMLLRALWGQLVFRAFGADERRMRRMRDASLRLAKGWDQAKVRALVDERLAEVIEPIVFDEALELMAHHRAEGRLVFLVSASPTEIVEPLARHLGVDEAIASQAELDEHGRYTGRVAFYAYGAEKAVAIRELAAARGIDLDRSYAYSDSATDLPMLTTVGFPVAVNPDRELRRVATERGWDVRTFTHRVPLRWRVPMPPPRTTAAIGATALAGATAGGVVWWLLRRRQATR